MLVIKAATMQGSKLAHNPCAHLAFVTKSLQGNH